MARSMVLDMLLWKYSTQVALVIVAQENTLNHSKSTKMVNSFGTKNAIVIGD